MLDTQRRRLIQWFARCGDAYIHAYLDRIDLERLATDRIYGLKAFLFMWAYERAGAPRAYRIAAIKAVSSSGRSLQRIPQLFRTFCSAKLNDSGNPALDYRIAMIDVPEVVQRVRDGSLEEAFSALDLKGVAHKLRAFFLRDVVTLLRVETNLARDPEKYLWCQPIDVWVRTAAEELCDSKLTDPAPRSGRKFRLSRSDRETAWGVVQLSLDAGVSPLKVNQGIWYFASNAVADTDRLRILIRTGNPKRLDAELALVRGFLPARFSWS